MRLKGCLILFKKWEILQHVYILMGGLVRWKIRGWSLWGCLLKEGFVLKKVMVGFLLDRGQDKVYKLDIDCLVNVTLGICRISISQ